MPYSFAKYDRVVIGGGIFGCYAALHLSNLGYTVLLIDTDKRILNRASYVNQARLHTGLHYPRSLITGLEARKYYSRFKDAFPESVKYFKQIYAVSKHNSKTSGAEFRDFINRLGAEVKEVDSNYLFNQESIDCAFEIEEPTFDSNVLRNTLYWRINNDPKITLKLKVGIEKGSFDTKDLNILLSDGSKVKTLGVVIAAYAATNKIRKIFELDPFSITYELTEVILGKTTPEMSNIGITVMDGPFWSIMPFGHTGLSSFTSVGLTPIYTNTEKPFFPCQLERIGCSSDQIAECNTCEVKPHVDFTHHLRQMSIYLKNYSFFRPENRLVTVKSIMSESQVDDSRPTIIRKEAEVNIWTIFSGKVSTLFDIDGELQ